LEKKWKNWYTKCKYNNGNHEAHVRPMILSGIIEQKIILIASNVEAKRELHFLGQ